MRRNLLVLLVAVFTAITSISVVQARSLDDVVKSGYLEVAVYRDFPPYSYLDEQQQAAGIDVELGTLIAAGLGVEVRWFWLTAGETAEDDLRNAVWKGHYLDRRVADLMMRVPYDREFSYAIDGYGAAKNDQVVMFAPYQQEQWVLARDLDKVGNIRNLAIFQYQKVGVELDSLPDFYLSGAYGGRLRDNVVHFLSVFLALEALRGGELSAVAGMRGQIEWGLGEFAGDYDIDDDGLGQITKGTWDIGLAVKHTHRQLGYAVEAVVEEALADGRVAQIFKARNLTYRLSSLHQAAD